MSGDYEFLCHMYGISGASGECPFTHKNYSHFNNNSIGRHCCLWCTITSEQLIVPRATRPVVHLRTLDNLAQRYAEFLSDGGNLKKAKLHENVIDTTFFDIPLLQVQSKSQCS